jgi:hypothetical protein
MVQRVRSGRRDFVTSLRPAGRTASRALVALGLLGSAACGSLLGIDDVEPLQAGGASGQAGAGPTQGSAGAGGTAGVQGAGGGGTSGTAGGGGSGGGLPGPFGFIRFANVRAFAAVGPEVLAFDLCVRRAGSGSNEWQGPILRQNGLPGLGSEQATSYRPLPIGTYEAMAVPEQFEACASQGEIIGLNGRALEIRDGALTTIAIAGTPIKPELVPFPDGRPRPKEEDQIELVLAAAAPGIKLSLYIAGQSGELSLSYGDAEQRLLAAGAWPVVEMYANDQFVLPLSPPELAPPPGYTAFFVPGEGLDGAPIAAMVCDNTPPRLTDPDELFIESCKYVPFAVSEPFPLP